MKSWKTTLGGIITTVGLLISAGTGVYHMAGLAIAGFGSTLLGAAARDHNVSSEQAGIK